MAKIRFPKQREYGEACIEFLDIAYKDYLAARVLLNAGMPAQGASLASTAVEKYFKAILAFRGAKAHGHLRRAHWNSAKNYDKNLSRLLSASFLELLRKAYLMRYTEDLTNGFNLVIATREFLAELDHTAMVIQRRFQYPNVLLSYDADLRAKDARLTTNNFVISMQDKQAFISAEPQLVYEVRKDATEGLLEFLYVAGAGESDGDFTRTGCRTPNAGSKNVQLAFATHRKSQGEAAS